MAQIPVLTNLLTLLTRNYRSGTVTLARHPHACDSTVLTLCRPNQIFCRAASKSSYFPSNEQFTVKLGISFLIGNSWHLIWHVCAKQSNSNWCSNIIYLLLHETVFTEFVVLHHVALIFIQPCLPVFHLLYICVWFDWFSMHRNCCLYVFKMFFPCSGVCLFRSIHSKVRTALPQTLGSHPK